MTESSFAALHVPGQPFLLGNAWDAASAAAAASAGVPAVGTSSSATPIGLGVARVSLGNFVHDRLMRIARETLERARDTGNFEHVF